MQLYNFECTCAFFSLQGVDIVKKALKIPCFTIASNAGVDAQEIVTRVMQTQEGYDARVGQFVDMMKAGIIDPTKVCKKQLLLYNYS